MLCVLAIDCAMNTSGWAVGNATAARPAWGVYNTERWCKQNSGRELARWREWLDGMLAEHQFNAIAIEQVFVDVSSAQAFNFSGTQAQMMLSGILFEWAFQHAIPVHEVSIDDWRAHFLGFNRRPRDSGKKGDFWKALAMKVAAQRNWFVEFHDSAEALGILDYTLSTLDQGYRHRTAAIRGRQELDRTLGRGKIYG